MMVRRGLQRMFFEEKAASLPELTLKTGRRADLVVLDGKGMVTIVEIKSSIEDFRVDTKWPDYRDFCDRFYFATHSDVPLEIFPQSEGLILADTYGAEIVRRAEDDKLSAGARKAITQRFASAAAERLLMAEWSATGDRL
mgnify:CR=1 FL=1